MDKKEGKTKRLERVEAVRLHVKQDLTAGDGKKHDIVDGKDKLSTRTICNNFELLKACSVPVAYYGQDSETSFIAPDCDMRQLEVVVRVEAHGSYLERNPTVTKGTRFPEPIVEFYLKTEGKVWQTPKNTYALPSDDPLLVFTSERKVRLHDPHVEFKEDGHFLEVDWTEVFDTRDDDARLLTKAEHIAVRAFRILEHALMLRGKKLVDFKVEFGYVRFYTLLLADDIDNGSWRLLDGENYLDKQRYRDGESLDKVLEGYELVAALTDVFREPTFQADVREWAKVHAPA